MTTRGDIIYRDATNTTTRLGAGTANQVIISDGTDIAWGGDVSNWNTAFGWGDHSLAGYLDATDIGTNVQAWDAGLDDISGLAVTDGNFIVGDGANWVAESGATARTSLGLGNVEDTALSTWAGSVNITTLGTIGSGTWQGTAIGEVYGGTNQTTYATGDILYASAADTLAKLAAGTDGHVLTLASGVPTWAASQSMPSGTTNNSTLRYDTGTSTWQENTNFLASSAGTLTIAAGQSYTGAGTVTLSSGTGTGLTITGNAASTWSTTAGNLTIDSAAALNLGTANATSVAIGQAGVTTTNAGPLTVSQLLTGSLGATISGAGISLNDNSNFNTTINTGTSTGTVTMGSANAGAITVTSGAAISITSGTTNALTLDSGTTGAINIGTGANAKTITIGNNTGASTLNLNAGTGSIVMAGTATGTSATFLRLPVKTDAGDPTTTQTNGAMYYNSNTNKFRCYENGAWTDCISAGGSGYWTRIGTNLSPTTAGDDLVLNTGETLTIGGGTAITRHLSQTFTNVTTNSIASRTCSTYATLSFSGVTTSDTVLGVPQSGVIAAANLSWNFYVSAANEVTIKACNPTTGAINTADTETWRIDVWQH
ncbi:MAG TPA: hypothetical protein ENN28_00120 [Candidatus Uhrbacteria bacterium]|nr:hypothetical protein [Candidatus Uhrbacteria bacterium]